MSWISQIYRDIRASVTTYIDSETRNYIVGPEPDLSPNALLYELDHDRYLKGSNFVNGLTSLVSTGFLPPATQRKSVENVQKALIALGLFEVDTSQKNWWKTPRAHWDDSSGGIAWGHYGRRTVKAVGEFQEIAGITGGLKGNKFNIETLEALKTALKAMVKGEDWREAVEPPVEPPVQPEEADYEV